MIFHSPQKSLETEPSFKLFNRPIKRAYEQKLLGIYLDHKLTWKPHINKLKKEFSQINGLLYHMRGHLSLETRILLYNALFHSKLCYAIETWGLTNKTSIQRLQRTHIMALKTVYDKHKRFSTVELYRDVAKSTLPIRAQHDYQVALMFYKIKSNIAASNLNFTKINHRYALRRRSNLTTPAHSNSYGLKRFERKATVIWNELVNNNVQRNNLFEFKR